MPTSRVAYDKLLRDSRLGAEELGAALPLLKVSSELKGDELEIEVTPDRPDLLGEKGLAMALARFLGHETPKLTSINQSDVVVIQDEKTRKYRGYFQGFFVENVSLDEADIKNLMNFQEVLHKTYCRNREKASIGVHDARGITQVTYFVAPLNSTKFAPLGQAKEMTAAEVLALTDKGKEYSHLVPEDEGLFLASNLGIMSMPPIINASGTQVTQDTKRLFVDVEGTDEKTVNMITALLVRELSGYGDVAGVAVKLGPNNYLAPKVQSKEVGVDLDHVRELLGVDLKDEEVAQALVKMGHEVLGAEGKTLLVRVPYYRFDVMGEVDLVEDVMMGLGLDKLSPKLPSSYTVGGKTKDTRLKDSVRNLLANLGYVEISTTVLSSADRQTEFYGVKPVAVENPVSASYDCLRAGLLPDLIQALSVNKKKSMPLKLFEVGPVIRPDGSRLVQELNAAAVLSDFSVGVEDIEADLMRLLRELGIPSSLTAEDKPFSVRGRAATFKNGWIAEISPEILLKNNYEFPVCAFEITLQAQFVTEISDSGHVKEKQKRLKYTSCYFALGPS